MTTHDDRTPAMRKRAEVDRYTIHGVRIALEVSPLWGGRTLMVVGDAQAVLSLEDLRWIKTRVLSEIARQEAERR